jgi:hypothetical protein
LRWNPTPRRLGLLPAALMVLIILAIAYCAGEYRDVAIAAPLV